MTEPEALKFILDHACWNPIGGEDFADDPGNWRKYEIDLHCDRLTVIARKTDVAWDAGYEVQSITSARDLELMGE